MCACFQTAGHTLFISNPDFFRGGIFIFPPTYLMLLIFCYQITISCFRLIYEKRTSYKKGIIVNRSLLSVNFQMGHFSCNGFGVCWGQFFLLQSHYLIFFLLINPGLYLSQTQYIYAQYFFKERTVFRALESKYNQGN